MRITLGRLKRLISEAAKVTAHPSYLKKERVREELQGLVVEAISSGEIKDQKGLDDMVATITMALNALKMVPFEVYRGMTRAG